MATVLIVADTVLVPAAVDVRVPVATPVAFGVAEGCGTGFSPVGLAASTTVAPAIGLPLASFAVTVIVLVSVPALIDVGAAATLDCAAETPPAVTVTVAVCVIATELMVADRVLVPAAVELRVPVATPLAFVVAIGCVSVFPAVGLAARTTVAPATGLPLASFAVTVIVLVSVPAPIGDVAVPVDWAADSVPALSTIGPEVAGVSPEPPPKLSV